MAHIGDKRPAEDQVPSEEDKAQTSPVKRVHPGSGFTFRPSALNKATQGFQLRQSSLVPKLSSSDIPDSTRSVPDKPPESSPQGGFIKLDSDDLTPISILTPSVMATGGVAESTANQIAGELTSRKNENSSAQNHSETRRENPFMQFINNTSSTPQTFSQLLNAGATDFSQPEPVNGSSATPLNETSQDCAEPEKVDESRTSGLSSASGSLLQPAFDSSQALGSHPIFVSSPALPEVKTITGEEGEKNVVHISARLYAFDAAHHSWKERGRGELRLNDSCQSEGLFQSRLVMRASGSHRVLLNTHLWAEMKCERANQKNIRITAQDSEDTVSVFLIMGTSKDIQQLFTAVDRRLVALKRNAQHSEDGDKEGGAKDMLQSTSNVSFDDDDKESFLEDSRSSPDSSPDTHSRRLVVPVSAPDQIPVVPASVSDCPPCLVSVATTSSGNHGDSVDCSGDKQDCEKRGEEEEEEGEEEEQKVSSGEILTADHSGSPVSPDDQVSSST